MAKQKETFKRGDQVLYVRLTDYGLTVSQAVVTATKGDTVYAKHTTESGDWKFSFSPDGNFHRDSYPLWAIRKLKPDDSIEKLNKRARKASDAYRAFKDKWAEMEREVERLAWEWKRNEIDKRQS